MDGASLYFKAAIQSTLKNDPFLSQCLNDNQNISQEDLSIMYEKSQLLERNKNYVLMSKSIVKSVLTFGLNKVKVLRNLPISPSNIKLIITKHELNILLRDIDKKYDSGSIQGGIVSAVIQSMFMNLLDIQLSDVLQVINSYTEKLNNKDKVDEVTNNIEIEKLTNQNAFNNVMNIVNKNINLADNEIQFKKLPEITIPIPTKPDDNIIPIDTPRSISPIISTPPINIQSPQQLKRSREVYSNEQFNNDENSEYDDNDYDDEDGYSSNDDQKSYHSLIAQQKPNNNYNTLLQKRLRMDSETEQQQTLSVSNEKNINNIIVQSDDEILDDENNNETRHEEITPTVINKAKSIITSDEENSFDSDNNNLKSMLSLIKSSYNENKEQSNLNFNSTTAPPITKPFDFTVFNSPLETLNKNKNSKNNNNNQINKLSSVFNTTETTTINNDSDLESLVNLLSKEDATPSNKTIDI